MRNEGTKKLKTGFIIVICVVSVILLAFLSTAARQPLPSRSPSWQLLGTNTPAANESTKIEKTIWTLTAWNGRIYMGYGDSNDNNKPTHIVSYDPLSNTFLDHWLSSSKAIYTYRFLLNRLFAPAMTRIKNADYAVGEYDNIWSDRVPFTSAHAYDMASLTDSDLWLTLTKPDSQGCIYRSSDEGQTWQQSLCGTAENTSRSEVKYYGIGVLRGKLYLQPRDGKTYSEEVSEPKSKLFDGTTWSDGPQITTTAFWHPDTFANKIVFLSDIPAVTASNTLSSFDGTKTVTVLTNVQNTYFDVATNTYYVLLTSGVIKKTNNLTHWTTVATAPPTTRSIVLLNGALYAGTTDSKLYVYTASAITPGVSLSPTPSPTLTPPAQ